MVDDIHSADEVEKRFQSLPEEAKKLLYSEEMHAIVMRVGQKHQLHIDQLALLEAETGQVMLGFVDTKDYPNELMESLKVDQAKAGAIAQDMNVMLFLKIRDAMKGVGGQTASTPTALPTQPAKPALSSQIPSSSPTKLPQPSAPQPSPSIPASKPQVPLAPHPHDLMLVEKTVTTPATPPKTPPAPATPGQKEAAPPPPKPVDYKADPYREPVEP